MNGHGPKPSKNIFSHTNWLWVIEFKDCFVKKDGKKVHVAYKEFSLNPKWMAYQKTQSWAFSDSAKLSMKVVTECRGLQF